MLFLESDEVCETSYLDRGGKYQGQRGVTLPILKVSSLILHPHRHAWYLAREDDD